MTNLKRYTRTTVPTRFSEPPKQNFVDVLTSGVTVKHDLAVNITPETRTTILGAVGILAGAAVLAVLLARRR